MAVKKDKLTCQEKRKPGCFQPKEGGPERALQRKVIRKKVTATVLFALGFIQLAAGIGIQNYVPLVLGSCFLYGAVRQRMAASDLSQQGLTAEGEKGAEGAKRAEGTERAKGTQGARGDIGDIGCGIVAALKRWKLSVKKWGGPVLLLVFAGMFLLSSLILRSPVGYLVAGLFACFGVKKLTEKAS